MKMIKGLIVAAASILLSSVATAALEKDATLEMLQATAAQTASFDEQAFCRKEPEQCYCTYIGGRKYCFILYIKINL